MRSKKEIEKIILNSFLEASSISVDNIEDSEAPDFILDQNQFKIGCEITEYYPDYSSNGSEQKKREDFINKLHNQLRELIINNFPRGFSFTINYSSVQTSKSNIRTEVDDLIKSIKNNIDTTNIKNPSINVKSIFIKKIDNVNSRIILMTSSDYQDPKMSEIIKIIDSKTEGINKWKSKTDKKWLLIVVGISRTNDLNLRRLDNFETFKSEYWDKIALIDLTNKNFKEINAT